MKTRSVVWINYILLVLWFVDHPDDSDVRYFKTKLKCSSQVTSSNSSAKTGKNHGSATAVVGTDSRTDISTSSSSSSSYRDTKWIDAKFTCWCFFYLRIYLLEIIFSSTYAHSLSLEVSQKICLSFHIDATFSPATFRDNNHHHVPELCYVSDLIFSLFVSHYNRISYRTFSK